MKIKLPVLLAIIFIFQTAVYAVPLKESDGVIPAVNPVADMSGIELGLKSVGAILIEADTGTVLYEYNADAAYPPASVTKVMSLLLIMECIDDGRITLEDKVTASDYACSMGGSQVFLAPGEEMSVHELLKCVVVSSANDATVALAEYTYGSVDAFIAKMNERAKELGMENSVFKNTTGLDEDGHVLSARDIAIMSRELIKHKKIFDYTTIWMDTIRNGEFGLSNTNKLIRFYNGANGLKTGSTSIAKYCLSATALRNNMQLIAVVMAAPTSDDRFADAKKMLDYGFATFAVVRPEKENFEPLKVLSGVKNTVEITHEEVSFLIGKGQEKQMEKQIFVEESIKAPVKEGVSVGTIKYLIGGKEIRSIDVVTVESVDKISAFGLFARMLGKYFMID